MIYDKLIQEYSTKREDYIVLSSGKLAKSLGMFGKYSNVKDMIRARALYFLMQDMNMYNEETKAFLYSELEKLSIKSNICKP